MKRVDCFFVLLLCPLFINTAKAVLIQRANSCAVMEVGQAQAAGKRCEWEFELKLPGTYLFQLIASVANAHGNPVVTVEVDGASFSDSLEKVTLIEDGVVWQGTRLVTLTEVGRHRIGVESELSPVMVRLVPQAYAKSRILISSSKYYGPWLKMHQSPPKQTALARFKEARFGMFVHWGLYSQAGGTWKGTRIEKSPYPGPRVAEWLMSTFRIPRTEYAELAKTFNPDKSFAANIARLAKDTGMKYVVITAKHHDGFALFDSDCSDFDMVDATPYQADAIKELYDACLAEGLEFGVYYSHGNDWHDGTDGNYANVKKRNDVLGIYTRAQGKNLWDPSANTQAEYLEQKAYRQIAELLHLMPELRLIWFDGEGLITEEQAFRFYKLVYDINPNVIVNRRVGYDFGDYLDAGDNVIPSASAQLERHWETCGTTNNSWGYKSYDEDWKSTRELLYYVIDIASKGGNYLLNIGPDGQGHVSESCAAHMRELGQWVRTNGDALFGTTRWEIPHEGQGETLLQGTGHRAARGFSRTFTTEDFWFTAKENKVYAMSLVPAGDFVRIYSLNKAAGTIEQVRLLGSEQKIKWEQTTDALELDAKGWQTGEYGFAIEVVLE